MARTDSLPLALEKIRLMGAVVVGFALDDPRFVYERKEDGMRTKAAVWPGRGPGRGPGGVVLQSKDGNDKTRQFPDVVRALEPFRRRLTAPVVLDGEIVALTDDGTPAGFERLQGRLHLRRVTARDVERAPVAFIVFDLLFEGREDCRSEPWRARRARLERVFAGRGHGSIRLSKPVGDGRALYEEVTAQGGEGIIVKRIESPYRGGKDHRDWRKLKLLRRQEFVVGGYTESRSRPFQALLIGVYDDSGLRYVGRMGKAYSDAELGRLSRLLKARETLQCPFIEEPDPDATPHWVRPELVIEAKFTEWTRSGKLREPTYLGLRTDVAPLDVRREPDAGVGGQTKRRRHRPELDEYEEVRYRLAALTPLGGGLLQIRDKQLKLTNLRGVIWPDLPATKADLMQYYIDVAPYLLPAIEDRPLSFKRFPHGIQAGDTFHQRIKWRTPPGVRVEPIKAAGRVFEPRLIGGSVLTLLYAVQIDIVSMDPWLSKVTSPDEPDIAVIDVDPMPGTSFATVVDVVRWTHDLLLQAEIPHFVKTSGMGGMHVVIPLAPASDYRTARIFAQTIADRIATAHPKQATVERRIADRGRRVYLDCDQNMRAKTLAAPYSARHSSFAGVSAPVTWDEVEEGIRPEDFTIRTIPKRLKQMGDLWEPLRRSAGIDIRRLVKS